MIVALEKFAAMATTWGAHIPNRGHRHFATCAAWRAVPGSCKNAAAPEVARTPNAESSASLLTNHSKVGLCATARAPIAWAARGARPTSRPKLVRLRRRRRSMTPACAPPPRMPPAAKASGSRLRPRGRPGCAARATSRLPPAGQAPAAVRVEDLEDPAVLARQLRDAMTSAMTSGDGQNGERRASVAPEHAAAASCVDELCTTAERWSTVRC